MKNYSVSGIRYNMIDCPKGTFTMGHSYEEYNRPRKESIERAFLLGETVVTQELYEAVMGTNPSVFKNPQNPVENLSWVEAIRFCNELSKLQGLDQCYAENSDSDDFGWDFNTRKNGYRLPTEKEWEYAAKAGTENLYSGTDDYRDLAEYGWFGEKSATGSTHPVATKKPNEWGFYDMSGNVREWCWDKINPNNTFLDAGRVNRGGNWCCLDGISLRSSFRLGNSPAGIKGSGLGFRLCRNI